MQADLQHHPFTGNTSAPKHFSARDQIKATHSIARMTTFIYSVIAGSGAAVVCVAPRVASDDRSLFYTCTGFAACSSATRLLFPPCKQSPLPNGVPEIVTHALAEYCRSGLGTSLNYVELGQAFMEWTSM